MIAPSGQTKDIPLDQSSLLPTGSDYPDHRKRLTQPQDVISKGRCQFSTNEAFPFILGDVKRHKMAALASVTKLLTSLFLIGCLAQETYVSLPQGLPGTDLKIPSEFWQ